MSIELKVKAKTLATESQIIRQEQRRIKARMRNDRLSQYRDKNIALYNHMASHRSNIVSVEARCTHLAKAFLKNTPYAKVEDPDHTFSMTNEIIERVARMVSKYGPMSLRLRSRDDIEFLVESWMEADL